MTGLGFFSVVSFFIFIKQYKYYDSTITIIHKDKLKNYQIEFKNIHSDSENNKVIKLHLKKT